MSSRRSARPPPRRSSSQAASSVGRSVDLLDLGAARAAARGDLCEFLGLAGDQHELGAGRRQHLRGERAEGAGRAGDDRDLARDVEQRQRILDRERRSWLHSRRIGNDDQHGADVVACD